MSILDWLFYFAAMIPLTLGMLFLTYLLYKIWEDYFNGGN